MAALGAAACSDLPTDTSPAGTVDIDPVALHTQSTLTVTLDAPVYNPGTGHYYQVITEGRTRADAKLDAAGRTHHGQPGYLAVINTPQEQDFVFALTQNYQIEMQYWLGGEKTAPAGATCTWWWDDGTSIRTPSEPDCGHFDFWGTETAIQPSGDGSYMALLNNEGGHWNDLDGSWTNFAVVEYDAPAVCPAGTYDIDGECVLADPGFFVDQEGAEAQTACPVGRYQPSAGATSCLLADPGFFVATTGAVAQTACLEGSYQPFAAATSCFLADPGFFVASTAAVAQTACPEGKYQPLLGATSCLLADPGFFVATTGAVEQTRCEEGFTSLAGATFCVSNIAPVVLEILGLPVDPIATGTSVGLSVRFTDPDVTDTHTAIIKWGDGTETAGLNHVFVEGDGEFDGSHTYAAAGVYTVEVIVEDNNNAIATAAYRFVVVYDPDGGFVSGAGWIDVPADSYMDNPNAEGSARFGFQAKYRKGQTRPDGNTQFHFRAGGMHFRSSSYDWLVVAGARAQYKGEGTINGDGGYCFMLTAIDGQLSGGGDADELRLKVWTCLDDTSVVFDNLGGATEDDATTAISKGNIVIHP